VRSIPDRNRLSRFNYESDIKSNLYSATTVLRYSDDELRQLLDRLASLSNAENRQRLFDQIHPSRDPPKKQRPASRRDVPKNQHRVASRRDFSVVPPPKPRGLKVARKKCNCGIRRPAA